MDEFPISLLFGLLFILLLLSAFFSGSETALMALNRYRLQHLVNSGHRGAIRASRLLERQDRLIGVILLGNNFVNIVASAIATVIGIRLYGEAGIAVATIALTITVLIFSEVTPKTLGAIHPERVALPASFVYGPLQVVLYPIVWAVSGAARVLLHMFGVSTADADQHSLSSEELRTVVAETSAMIPRRHQHMLLSILDLENATVEDIMVPRNEIVGIDISESWDAVLETIKRSQHTRLPVFSGSIDDLRGIVHLRRVLAMVSEGTLNHESLTQLSREPYFIPEGTALNQQLLNFQKQRRRIGFVVDEYGDIQGLVTLEDILEEIVGEFTTDPAMQLRNVKPQPDGSFVVNAMANVRTLNRSMSWSLPSSSARTLNGLILEKMESIPQVGARLKLNDYAVEILETRTNGIQSVRILPPRPASRTGS